MLLTPYLHVPPLSASLLSGPLRLKYREVFHPADCWRQIIGRAASLLSGSHSVEWDAGHLASGVYLYRLEAGGFVETRKLIPLE